MTQASLAERSGVAFQTINRIERGHSPSPRLETIAKLAEALGVDLKWLAFGNGDESGAER